MVASYAQESSIEQAFKETFGGDRPCEMCQFITAVDESQEDTPLKQTESGKLALMLGLARAIQIHVPEADVEKIVYAVRRPKNTRTEVPSPPPKWL